MSKLTAMYIFAGYRDYLKKSESGDDINFNFSCGGEVDAADRISGIAELFDKGFAFPKSHFPGVLEYEVLEAFGAEIAKTNESENDLGDGNYLSCLTVMVMRWIVQGKNK